MLGQSESAPRHSVRRGLCSEAGSTAHQCACRREEGTRRGGSTPPSNDVHWTMRYPPSAEPTIAFKVAMTCGSAGPGPGALTVRFTPWPVIRTFDAHA